jgi:hypothetical protein
MQFCKTTLKKIIEKVVHGNGHSISDNKIGVNKKSDVCIILQDSDRIENQKVVKNRSFVAKCQRWCQPTVPNETEQLVSLLMWVNSLVASLFAVVIERFLNAEELLQWSFPLYWPAS